jgi:hypothetical protein
MLSEQLDEVVPGDPNGRTYAEAVAEALVERAIRGNVSATKLILLLVEGPPPRQMEVEGACSEVRIVSRSPAARQTEMTGRAHALLGTGTEGRPR